MAKVATLDEIQVNQTNLSIPLYVRPTMNGKGVGTDEAGKPLAAVIAEWQLSSESLRESMDELFNRLTEAGLDPAKFDS